MGCLRENQNLGCVTQKGISGARVSFIEQLVTRTYKQQFNYVREQKAVIKKTLAQYAI
jgi:hypothetical protein